MGKLQKQVERWKGQRTVLLSNLNSLKKIDKEVIGLDIVSLSFAELFTDHSEHGFVKPMSVLKRRKSGIKSMVK